ncbi:hypothetical protein DVH05_005563 [Phytophthora capsici]|nr:hypothetical protein DVH05_005563 [Phytophthora capsici]|eukprot:jgi/Phyca11/108142/e_gw1.14.443.1
MRTDFFDWEDKQLVQIALEFENEVIRVTWDYVAPRMTKSKRTASQLRLRFASLKRTFGKTLKNFPRCFLGEYEPPRLLVSSDKYLFGLRAGAHNRIATQHHSSH